MYKELEGKAIKIDGHKLLLVALKFIVISRRISVPYYRAIFQPGPD
jgi:hypothetical protein